MTLFWLFEIIFCLFVFAFVRWFCYWNWSDVWQIPLLFEMIYQYNHFTSVQNHFNNENRMLFLSQDHDQGRMQFMNLTVFQSWQSSNAQYLNRKLSQNRRKPRKGKKDENFKFWRSSGRPWKTPMKRWSFSNVNEKMNSLAMLFEFVIRAVVASRKQEMAIWFKTKQNTKKRSENKSLLWLLFFCYSNDERINPTQELLMHVLET